MKQAVLLHGTGGDDKDYFWFADIKQHLKDRDYTVWWPALPNTDKPTLEESYNFVHDNLPTLDNQSIIIGHSSGCPLALSILQREDVHIKQAILVSGYYASIGNVVSDRMIEKDGYDWNKIKRSADEIVLINSDDDPWGCNDQQARPVAQNLNATFVLAKGQGHMGSSTFNQPYRENKFVKELLQ